MKSTSLDAVASLIEDEIPTEATASAQWLQVIVAGENAITFPEPEEEPIFEEVPLPEEQPTPEAPPEPEEPASE